MAKKDEDVFKKYLLNKKILVVDPSSSARSGIFKTLNDLGAKTSQIILCNNFASAQEEIRAHKPHIVMAEYDLGKSCGLELLQSQRLENPDSKKCLFVLITGNSSQTAVARSAEEDVDAYVLKPFTPEVLRNTIMAAAVHKIQPPPYYLKIDEGKAFIEKGDLDAAEKCFTEATSLDSKPSLALYYLGQIKAMREMMSKAQGDFQRGLEFNKIHYKCLVGLFDVLMKNKEYAEAYEVVKRVSQYFPANPKRLADVLRLAIMNQKYEDVEKYYSIFCNIDERSEILIKYICAALVVCGKFYLQTKNRSRALELFQKAAATSAGRTGILREIVMTLYEHRLAKESVEFLGRFPPETQGSEEYQLLRFFTVSLTATPTAVVALGKDLLSKKMGNEEFYAVMIAQALLGKANAMAENLAFEAAEKFPQKRERFLSLVKSTAA